MNKELLLKVKAQILAEPMQFQMGTWFTSDPVEDGPLWNNVKIPNCGTAACIAGWAIALHQNKKPSKAFGGLYAAADYLDIDIDDAADLFYEDHWPDDLRMDWEDARSLTERAQIAADRIDRFIAEHDK